MLWAARRGSRCPHVRLLRVTLCPPRGPSLCSGRPVATRFSLFMRQRFGIMVAALWWGSLTGLGFVVVPMLFTHLASPAVAGVMAAKLFTAQTWLSIACSMFLLLIFNQKEDIAQSIRARPAIKFVVAGLLLTVLVEFAVAPHIVSARATGVSGVGDLRFWHTLGSAMYLGQWLCAAMSLWILVKPPNQQ